MEYEVSKHILIVEDSPDLQALLSKLFMGEGYRISCASDGLEALNLLGTASSLPDLILLDIMLPNMDGVEFRQVQKTDPRIAVIPVIVMSAGSTPPDLTAKLDAAAIVRKPINDIDELLEKVERLCQ